MGLWDKLAKGAKDALAQQRVADSVAYPAGSTMWTPGDLKAFHDSVLTAEEAVAEGLGKLLTLRLYLQLPVSQRQETMGQVSHLVSRVFAYDPPAPVVIDMRQQQASWYAQGMIVLNRRTLHDLTEALHTALHESFHCYQKKTVDQWRRGEIPPGDPRAPIAPVWAYNFQHYIQPSPQRHDVYLRQPIEFHAERFADRVVARLSWLEAAAKASPHVDPQPAGDRYERIYGGGNDIYDQMYD